ncbi:hypothetical protein EJ06DRAFT_546889 [Trichodelitschia bisporula]|uniref:Mediator of RNA polymerase II transcription subunit 1 n=1 Tax=Trichodelitschia bisporula TaxID=703511 RepID=A0A6G1I6K4_9PEZI|nr:hypothetical protein EJ06DRAFT_546889 [Trichodelitschia bisporula]
MATPTPSSSAIKGSSAPINAATPQSHHHLGSFTSPAPRSVPSPTTYRTQAGKSPFNAASHQPPSSSTIQNHPTGGSTGSGANRLLGSSPAAAMLESPAAMALSLSNMGGLDGGIGMGISMSGLSALGISASMMGRGDDEERRKRLEAVVALVKTRPGKVSPEGLELLARNCGMEAMLDPPLAPRRNGTRECAIAGATVLVDVKFAKHIVKNVDISFPTSTKVVNEHCESAARVLKENLSLQPGLSTITLTLEKFSKNLERLARLDKLNGPSSAPNFNCFEAIAAVYRSLRKLYEHEKMAAMALFDPQDPDAEDKADREVMCKKSGRPQMNCHGNVGLNLDYWMKQRKVLRRGPRRNPDSANEESRNGPSPDVFTMSIECEHSPPELYTPVRISSAWISEQVEKPGEPDQPGSTVDWLDPPPTYLATQQDMTLGDGSFGKLPSVRFVAKLDPPVLLPLPVATNILSSVGVTLPPDSIQATTFDGMLLHLPGHDPVHAAQALVGPRKIVQSQRPVLGRGADGEEVINTHNNSLFVSKYDYGWLLEEIPFAHPRQLMQIIPILRQYAQLNTLIKDSFASEVTSPYGTATKASVSRQVGTVAVDISLMCTPVPRVSLVFPHNKDGEDTQADTNMASVDALLAGLDLISPISVTMEILPNADITVADQNLYQGDVSMITAEDKKHLEKISKAFDIAGDLGIWVEWVRGFAKST